MWYERAGGAQDLLAHAHAHPSTGVAACALGLCRSLCNTALDQRIIASQRRHVPVSRYPQEAELKHIRAELPEYAAIRASIAL